MCVCANVRLQIMHYNCYFKANALLIILRNFHFAEISQTHTHTHPYTRIYTHKHTIEHAAAEQVVRACFAYFRN